MIAPSVATSATPDLTEGAQPLTRVVMKSLRTSTLALLALFCASAAAQDKVIRLYGGPAPGSENWKQEEKENRTNLWQTRVVYNVASPTLTVFLPEPAKAVGTAVIICPGAFHIPRASAASSMIGRTPADARICRRSAAYFRETCTVWDYAIS